LSGKGMLEISHRLWKYPNILSSSERQVARESFEGSDGARASLNLSYEYYRDNWRAHCLSL